jgi:hypothetical protein
MSRKRVDGSRDPVSVGAAFAARIQRHASRVWLSSRFVSRWLGGIAPVHEAQLLTYLRLGGWQVGLLINFNVIVLKNGIRRRVLGLRE